MKTATIAAVLSLAVAIVFIVLVLIRAYG